MNWQIEISSKSVCVVGRDSFYCGATQGGQFLALQKTSASFAKKGCFPHKKYFFRRVGVTIERDLEEPGVV